MTSRNNEAFLSLEKALREIGILESLRCRHIERYALRASPTITPLIKLEVGETSAKTGVILGISLQVAFAIPYKNTLCRTYPQSVIPTYVEGRNSCCFQQGLIRNAGNQKSLRIQYQQASIIGTYIILSFEINYISYNMGIQKFTRREQLNKLSCLIYIIETIIRTNKLHLITDIERAHQQTLGSK